MCLKRKGQALLEQMEIAHATLKGGTALEYFPQILKVLIRFGWQASLAGRLHLVWEGLVSILS